MGKAHCPCGNPDCVWSDPATTTNYAAQAATYKQERLIAKYKFALQVILERAKKHSQWSDIIAIAKEALDDN